MQRVVGAWIRALLRNSPLHLSPFQSGAAILLLSCATAASLKAAPLCALAPNDLVSWWPGNGAALDVIGANHGSSQGSAGYTAGKVAQSFNFDAGRSGVVIGNPASLQLQNFTLEAWIRRSDASRVSGSGADGEIASYGLGGYAWGFYASGYIYLSQNGGTYVSTGRHSIADTQWHHVAVTKDGSAVAFYLDGQLDNVASANATFTFTTSFYIGTDNAALDHTFLGLSRRNVAHFGDKSHQSAALKRAGHRRLPQHVSHSSSGITVHSAWIVNPGPTGQCPEPS